MAWFQIGDKPLSDTMLTRIYGNRGDELMKAFKPIIVFKEKKQTPKPPRSLPGHKIEKGSKSHINVQ